MCTVNAVPWHDWLVGAVAGLETFEGAPQELIQWAEYVILAVFSVECIMKLVAEQAATWYYYFRRRMNLFDLAIVVICIVTTSGTRLCFATRFGLKDQIRITSP